jgi:hypothetical protein
VGLAELFAVGCALDFAVGLDEGFAFVVTFAVGFAFVVTFAEGFGVGFFVAASAFEPESARARIRKSEVTRDPI